jgi:hypothetical protein
MFEVRNETKNYRIKMGLLLLLIGLLASGVFFYFYYKIERKNNTYDSVTEANKIEPNCTINRNGDEACSPIYHYQINESNYVCKSEKSSSEFNENQKKVYYKKLNPTYCLTEFDRRESNIFLIGAIAGIVVIVTSIGFFIGAIIEAFKVKGLVGNGTIFKGVPFTLETSGDKKVTVPVVDLETPNGEKLHLVGKPISNRKFGNTGETVDVLIDLDNPSRYYIDFEIRMSGDFINNVIDYRSSKPDIFKENKEETTQERINRLVHKE